MHMHTFFFKVMLTSFRIANISVYALNHLFKYYSYFNSHGKTTLLRHIAERAFAIPPNIDVLYCEQEVVADDKTAVESVLLADVKRTSLLNECRELEKRTEAGDLEAQGRLNEVCNIYS